MAPPEPWTRSSCSCARNWETTEPSRVTYLRYTGSAINSCRECSRLTARAVSTCAGNLFAIGKSLRGERAAPEASQSLRARNAGGALDLDARGNFGVG